MEKTMEKIVALAKARGFVYPGSEIYGGLANTWDYGNLGVELKNNVKKAWWQKFVQENPYNVGVDCAILMNPQTWIASGHLGGFSDPLMDCKECKERFRADKLIEDFCAENGIALEESVDAWSQEQMKNFVEEHQIPCPTCGKHNFTDIRQFNLMFKTFQGVTEDAKTSTFLPLGVVITVGLNISCSVMGTLLDEVGHILCLVILALPEKLGVSLASTISPSWLSAIRIAPSFDQLHDPSLTTVCLVPSAFSISSCTISFVCFPY